jgi:glycosyltransferase involved in cell wall biosynthesis
MRVAMFTDSFHPELGGIQDSLLCLSRALGERGHDIVVYAPAASPRDYRVAGLPPTEVDLGAAVTVRRLFALPVPSSTGQSRLLVPTGRCWRELARFAPDVVHTHTFLGAGWEALRAADRLGVPLVGTNHWAVAAFGGYVPVAGERIARLGLQAVTRYYNRCALVTGPSRSVLAEMRTAGLRRPHKVVSNPIDTACFRPATPERRQALKQQLGFPEGTILYAGRLAAEKNIDLLVRALPLVLRQIPSAMLALAGHGSARGSLRDLAAQLGVLDRLRFLGTLDQPALADAFRAADVFAIASTSETQSMVLLQAMACGLPAVGVRSRALPESIGEDTGLLADAGDAAQFAQQLARLLRQPELRSRLGEGAARTARRFGVAETVAAWEDIYASCAATGALH